MDSQLIGDVIIEACTKYVSSKVLRRVPKGSFKIRRLGKRRFFIYALTADERMSITKYLYDVLMKMISQGVIKDVASITVKEKNLVIRLTNRKSLWYRLGLALSDGSCLSRSRIIFSTTTPHTLNSILYGFGNVSIYIARVMMYRRRDMPSCVINAIISDREVAEFMNKLRNNESSVADVVNMLKSHKDYLAQFLAGAIDGDGAVDRDTVKNKC